MLRVALTGGIATGKSYCLRRFAAHGRRRYRRRRARARGRRAGHPPGSTRSSRASVRACSRPTARWIVPRSAASYSATQERARDLEAIVHPEVYRRIREWFANLPASARGCDRRTSRCSSRPATSTTSTRCRRACDPEEQLRRVIGARRSVRSRCARAPCSAVADRREGQARGLRDLDRPGLRGNGRAGPNGVRGPQRDVARQAGPASTVAGTARQASDSFSFAGAIRSSTNVFHSWQCGHCQSSSVLR